MAREKTVEDKAVSIRIAHDFSCPWCYVALHQVRRMRSDFLVEVEWVGYELFPKEMEWPEPAAVPEQPANKPATPSRLQLMLAAEGISIPDIERPKRLRTYHAHQAVEHAKTLGLQDVFIERIYQAYWELGLDINDVNLLRRLATGLVKDLDALEKAILDDRYDDKVIDFDDPAHETGVFNVPTIFIGDVALAEQPYTVIHKAISEHQAPRSRPYSNLVFGKNPSRPYSFINMVHTIDGKILTGERDESVDDLGSKADHATMRRLIQKADGVMVGATTLRTSGDWNPATRWRIVATKSGKLDYSLPFFSEGVAILVVPSDFDGEVPDHVRVMKAGEDGDWGIVFNTLKREGIDVLNVLGGSELNAQLLRHDLIDEIFITTAPKVKLGADVPTMADGVAFTRDEVMRFQLIETHVVGDEIFARYQRQS